MKTVAVVCEDPGGVLSRIGTSESTAVFFLLCFGVRIINTVLHISALQR